MCVCVFNQNSVSRLLLACPLGETDIWISWEGAEPDTGRGRDTSYMNSKKQCEQMCNQLVRYVLDLALFILNL